MRESRAAGSKTAVSTIATAGAASTEELDSTGATDELEGALTSTEEELTTTADELDKMTEELETALLLEDFALDFLEAELAGALAAELSGATAGVAGAFVASGATEAELAGTEAGALASSSNSAKRSRTWPKESWARDRPKNRGKRANLRI
jgi:hypothetical protein